MRRKVRKDRFLDALAAHLRREKTTLVLDVGANTGQYATLLRMLGYEGDIISFEPVSESFQELKAAASSDGRWRVEQIALGNANERRSIHLLPRSDFNSFHQPNRFALDNIKRIEPYGMEEVQVRRLDDVIEMVGEGRDRASIFLKTDTQGHDLAVLEGAGDTLKSVTGIQAEIPVTALYEEVAPLNETLDHYARVGFRAFGFRPISWADGRMLEMDALFERL